MKKSWKALFSVALAAVLAAGSLGSGIVAPSVAIAGETVGTTYYIDARNGNDANDGKSAGKAWKTFTNVAALELTAGDAVRLKAGCTWNNEKLLIKNAKGTAGAPVILGKYGTGADPIINGNGNPWNDNETLNGLKKEDVAVVHVQNSEYITIEDLEVTNWEWDASDLMGERNASEGVIYDQSKSMLTGILVENHDAGECKGVVIQNNYVHDVNGYMSQNGKEGDKKGSGGIMVLVTGGKTRSYYTDLKILGNRVEKVCHEAIYMESCWAARTLVGGADSQQAGSQEWVGWPNVYVAQNYVHNVAGDGIVLINADGGTAEYNLVTKSASEEWNYSRNPAHAAIWMWDCNNVTMQYNEAAYTESTQDGMAFDCDYGNQNVMYQYNYSHDNKGGFWMACPGPYYTVNAVVRYNISVNDGLFDGGRIIRVGEYGSIGNQFYNNTMYWDTGYKVNAVEQASWGTPPTSGTEIYNNIFCGDSDTFVNNDGIRYDSNLVWGSVKNVYPTDEDVNAVVADPKFLDVTDHTTGTFSDGSVVLGKADGFHLQSDSPAVNRGRSFMAVPEESFAAVQDELVPTQITLENKDYAGNAVPYATGNAGTEYVDIGAYEYQGEVTIPEVTTDKTYVETLLRMAASYTEADFTAGSWADLQRAVTAAQAVIDRAFSEQTAIDAAAARLEAAIAALVRTDAYRAGTQADDVLAGYNAENGKDNSGFETSECDWGQWQSTAAVTGECARTGAQSLKVTQSTEGTTGFSELSNIPVEANTSYVFEAWIYAGASDVTKVGLEAKHHNSITSDKKDLKLNEMKLSADAETDANGWKKAVMSFTTAGYNKISIALSSDIATAYLDDVILYPAKVSVSNSLDKTALEAAIRLTPEKSMGYYSTATWKAYEKALSTAKARYVDAMAEQADIDAAAADLQEAYAKLTKKANVLVLKQLYDIYSKETQGNYTTDTWNALQKALAEAKLVLENDAATQAEADAALAAVKAARSALRIGKQSGSYSGGYSGGAASAAPDTTKPPKTPEESDQTDQKETPDESAEQKKPSKPTAQSVKAGKQKLVIRWKMDSNADGYEVQCAQNKSFQKGVKKTTVKGSEKTTVTIKKLKKGKKYYVRIRSYKLVTADGVSKKVYSAWSKVKVSGKIK